MGSPKINNKKKRGNILLETSMQIDKFVNGDVADTIKDLSKSNDMYSSYYCLFEFKTGLIRTMIDFHSLVNLLGSVKGFKKISGTRGRTNQNLSIMQALIFDLYDIIETKDKNKYLRQIEGAIFFAMSNFKTGIKNNVGDFSDNEIVKYDLASADTYDGFVELCNKNNFVKLETFLNTHIKKLETYLSHEKEFQSSEGLKAIHKNLKKIESDLPKYANMNNTSRGVADAIIAMDLKRKYRLASLDHSFAVLCPLINRGLYFFKKDGTYTEL